MAVHESAKVTRLEVFGVPGAVGLMTLLGRPGRTVAILTTARTLNLSALARLAEVETDGDACSLLDPIEADGIFESQFVGKMRLYRLTRHPWTPGLRGRR